MTPQTKFRLDAAAQRYLQNEPWKWIPADRALGLHDLETGLFGRVAMRDERAGCAFSVFLGEAGFALLEQREAGDLDDSLLRTRADWLGFVVVDLAERPKGEELLLRPEPIQAPARGYVTAVWGEVNRLPRPLTTEEALALTRFLTTLSALAEGDRVPRDFARCAPGRHLVYEVREVEEGLRFVPRHRAVAPVQHAHRPLQLPAPLLARLRALPRVDGRYLASVFVPEVCQPHKEGGYLWVAMVVDPEHPQAPALLECGQDFAAVVSRLFTAWSGGRNAAGGVLGLPEELWVDSFPVYQALQDAVRQLGVRLVSQDRQPQLREVKALMYEMVFRRV